MGVTHTRHSTRIPHCQGPSRSCLSQSCIHRGNLRASSLHSLLNAPLLACSQTSYHSGHCTLSAHLILLMTVRSGLLTKEEPGAPRGEVTHARSHSKKMAGPGFKPSSAARKVYRVPEVPFCPSSLLPTASESPSSPTPTPSAKSLLPTPGQNEQLPPHQRS